MGTYDDLDCGVSRPAESGVFLSEVLLDEAFFVSTMSIVSFRHADFGHSPVQQYRQS
jgi:hypothetical protein